MLKPFILLLTLLISVASASAAPPLKARIPSGIGILLISKVITAESSSIIIYKEPSVGRIAEVDTGRLPPLSQSISSPEGSIPVIVTMKKPGWYRVVYDDGEREGWIEGRPSFQLYGWKELLKNRRIILAGGLRKEFYLLRGTQESSSDGIETLGKGSSVISLRMDGDWIMVVTDSQRQGWLRWRDENSRLVIALDL